MTSWTRGKEHEEEGKEKMHSDMPGEKIAGAGETLSGDAEQGINNVGDRLSGKQEDLKGEERTGEDMNYAGSDADSDLDTGGYADNDLSGTGRSI